MKKELVKHQLEDEQLEEVNGGFWYNNMWFSGDRLGPYDLYTGQRYYFTKSSSNSLWYYGECLWTGEEKSCLGGTTRKYKFSIIDCSSQVSSDKGHIVKFIANELFVYQTAAYPE